MTVFDSLLRKIASMPQGQREQLIIPAENAPDLRSYFIDGCLESVSGKSHDQHLRIKHEGLEDIFVIEWSFANSALMIESGIHFFLSREAAMAWRDGHENDAFHSLEVTRLTEEKARRELEILELVEGRD